MSDRETYEGERLTFEQYPEDDFCWWAIDEHGVEYCIRPISDVGWDSEMWQTLAQKRVAFDEVKQGLGTYESFEEAVAVCDEFDPVAEGLV